MLGPRPTLLLRGASGSSSSGEGGAAADRPDVSPRAGVGRTETRTGAARPGTREAGRTHPHHEQPASAGLARAPESATKIDPRQSLRLSAEPVGAARGAPASRAESPRQQSRRKRHPAFVHRKEKLAFYRSSGRGPALSDPLLADRLV